MTSQHQASKNVKSSIRSWWIPREVQSSLPDNVSLNGDVHLQSRSHGKSIKQSDNRYSGNGLSTSQFISAVVGVWDFVGQPTVLENKPSLKYGEIRPKENISSYSDSSTNRPSSVVGGQKNSNDLAHRHSSPSSAKSDFEELKTIKRMLCFASCNKNINNLTLVSGSHSDVESSGLDEVTSTEATSHLAYTYGSISTKPYSGLKDWAKACDDTVESSIIGKSSRPANHSSNCAVSNSTIEDEDYSGSQTVNLEENVLQPADSLHGTYSLQSPVTTTRETITFPTSSSGDIFSNYNIGVLTSADWTYGQCEQLTESAVAVESSAEVSTSKGHIVHEKHKSLIGEDFINEDCPPKSWLYMQDKLQYAFNKNKHALAGAFAGTLVSLCIHPVDTVKTIIQAHGAEQKTLYDTFRAIISERGILGLYRGVSSNIASSAPISAIYTYTYESVKGALLPILPKEYHSFAHCIAGGCSSIATSFVFTPSERIKQQMQVGSHYRNCWNVLIGCLEKGGLPSLYAGWGAVLCRNIPHSMIKFYTYERLKELCLTSSKANSNLSTLQTLVCGGLAGSTAALFTTPFDVVKTRLQTQVPGSLAKYDGVLHALQEIAREEGLQGLYRGLAPRLAIYVSQGAIFFASYEFLKAIFSLESASAPSQIIESKENTDCVPASCKTLSC